jgi:hypothetical protein
MNNTKLDLVVETLFSLQDNKNKELPCENWFNLTQQQMTQHIYEIFQKNMINLNKNFENPWDIFNSLPIGYHNSQKNDDSNSKNNVPPSMKIVGITGRKFSGKDTVADYMCKNFGYLKIAFADMLKCVCGILFGLTFEQMYGSQKEVCNAVFGLSSRQILQYVGTEIFRNNMSSLHKNIGNDFWILCVDKQINKIKNVNPNAHFVISDVRFNNEINYIHENKCKVIRIIRSCVLNNEYSSHASEIDIDKLDFDIQIYNNAKYYDLFNEIDSLFQ